MKYIKFIIITLFTLTVLFTGCDEEFLDLNPVARETSETFYKDFNAVDATVTACYAELCAREVFDKDYFLVLGSIPADDVECGGESINDYPDAHRFDEFTHTLNEETPPLEIYQYCYKGLRFANTALDRLETIKEIDPEASDVLIARRKGEMKFMRGLYHFILVQVFGGVIVADHTIQPEEFNLSRNTIKEVFTLVEQDLKDAINLLPEKKDLGAEAGRATKGAAQALLAKVLIYESGYAKNYVGDPIYENEDDNRFVGCEERWADALSYAEAIMSSTDNYHLVGELDSEKGLAYASWRTGADIDARIDAFRWMFSTGGDNCAESIFEIQSVNDHLGWGLSRGNVMTVYQTVRKYTDADGDIADYGGWSFNCPTSYLIQAFGNSDPRETNINSAPADESLDPRFATTVGRDGDSILLGADYELVPMNFSNIPTGTIGRKFECGYNEYWGPNNVWDGPMNVKLLRLADIILLAAEAAFELGQTDKALEYVNRVRERARDCGDTGYPQALTAISFEDIMHERRLELACEPQRFFDLVRWGKAEEYLNGIPNEALGGADATFRLEFIKGKHEFWPLPLSEVQLNTELVQYPEWE